MNKLTQQEMEFVIQAIANTSIQAKDSAFAQGVLDELTKQTNILEKQEMERQIEKYDKDVQNQLKDVDYQRSDL